MKPARLAERTARAASPGSAACAVSAAGAEEAAMFSGSLGGLGAGQSGGRHGFCRLDWPAISRPGLTLCSTPTCTLPARRNPEKTTIGLYFADKKPDRTMIGFQVPPLFGSVSGLDIPAGEENYELTSSFTTPVDIELIGVGAHMHYLGHTAKATATLPDGTTKPLFYIDEWDFNWQNNYFTKTPFGFRPARPSRAW